MKSTGLSATGVAKRPTAKQLLERAEKAEKDVERLKLAVSLLNAAAMEQSDEHAEERKHVQEEIDRAESWLLRKVVDALEANGVAWEIRDYLMSPEFRTQTVPDDVVYVVSGPTKDTRWLVVRGDLKVAEDERRVAEKVGWENVTLGEYVLRRRL